VRAWNGHEYGPGGKNGLPDQCPVDKPLQPFGRLLMTAVDRELLYQGEQAAGASKHPPQKRRGRCACTVIFTVLMFALGQRTACSVSMPTWGRNRSLAGAGGARSWKQTRDHVIVFAQGCMASFHMGGILPAVRGEAPRMYSRHWPIPGNSRKSWARSPMADLISENFRSIV